MFDGDDHYLPASTDLSPDLLSQLQDGSFDVRSVVPDAATDVSRRDVMKTGATALAGLFGVGATSDFARGNHTEEVSVEIPGLSDYYYLSNTRGDEEFAGHGPEVTVLSYLTIRNTNELWSSTYMSAEETEPDWTTFSVSSSNRIWPYIGLWEQDPAKVGVEEIVSIDSDTYSYDSYTDTDHSDDVLNQPSGELVDRFVCEGDSDGDDDPSVRVEYNPISLTIRQPTDTQRRWAEYTSNITCNPSHTRGDREFDGHGPDVDVYAWIDVRNDNELWGTVLMYARETESNWTTFSGRTSEKIWDGDVYRVDEIVSIESDTYSYASYTDTDNTDDVLDQPSGELVDQFVCWGDSWGDDDPGVTVYFDDILLRTRYGGPGYLP